MGYQIKQLMTSGLENTGGKNYAVITVKAAGDLDAITNFQIGSVAYLDGDPDSLYVYLADGWKKAEKSSMPGGPAPEIDGINPHTLLMVNKLVLDRLTATEAKTHIADALPTVGVVEGQIAYDKSDHTLKVCQQVGEKEVSTLQVTTGTTGAGDVTITLNGVDFVVALGASAAVNAVATAIRAETYEGWVVTGETDSAIFTATTVGVVDPPAFVDTDGTSAEAAFTQTNEGDSTTLTWKDLINA